MSEFKFSTLDAAIRRALLGDDADNKKLYARAFVHARNWYEVEYPTSGEKSYGYRTEQLRVEVDRTAALPDDYVEWSMVGIRRGEQVYNLLHNPALVVMPERPAPAPVALPQLFAEPTAPVMVPEPAPIYEYCYTNWLENQGVDVVGYGYPSMRQGEFTVQRAERQLLLSSAISPGDVLLLHYLSTDAPAGQSTPIHPLAINWCQYWIKSFLLEKTNPGLAATYTQRAASARMDYMQMRSPFQIEDIYAAMRNTLARR